jgi:hypothetical protein
VRARNPSASRFTFLGLAALRSVKLEPLSRRRPLSSTGTGVIEGDSMTLIAFRFTPARLTQSSTLFEVEDCQAACAYFFFRRLVFFAPFFAADFVFDFLFFAMLPSSYRVSGVVISVSTGIANTAFGLHEQAKN